MNDDQYYLVRYRVEPGHFLKKDRINPADGLTDALIIGSVVYASDGGCSISWVSFDGRTKSILPRRTLINAWGLLANNLAEEASDELSQEEIGILKTAFQRLRAVRGGMKNK